MSNLKSSSRRAPSRLAVLVLALAVGGLSALHAQTYSQIIVFGDSLSDTGNDAGVSDDTYGFRVPGPGPGGAINYTDGRFTSGKDTDPASSLHGGIWHEQLAKLFLGLPAATASLDGGFDYAYGGATTENGTRELDFTSDIGITVNNMGQQVDDYLANHAVDPAALYIVWGGANDIFVSGRSADALLATGKQAAKREVKLIDRLAAAGAVNFLVPNLPPIGSTPRYNGSAGDITAYDNACLAFGAKLTKKLDQLGEKYAAAGTPISLKPLDVYGLFTRLLANQQAFNLYNIVDSAQGESVKADNYLFWDDVHPTATGHYQLALEAYTALTGRPLVQVAPNFDASGFYLTRSGADLSTTLNVPYSSGGTATPGTDYKTLKGFKKIQPDNFSVLVKAKPLSGSAANGKIVLLDIADGGDAFGVGTVTEARIQYGNPIRSTSAINETPATPKAKAYPRLMLPGSGR